VSSIKVVFHFFKSFKIDLYSIRVDLPLLKSKFFSFPAISLLARVGVGGWGKAENKAKLSPAGAGSWAELGNIYKLYLMVKLGKFGQI
jgi:hypothetical protein